MESLYNFLLESMALHPKMEVQDAVKFVYQGVLGGGHMITDAESSLLRLKSEYAAVSYDSQIPVLERLSSDYVRVNIAAVKGRLTPETLNAVFVSSSNEIKKSPGQLPKVLDLVVKVFGDQDAKSYISSYIQRGCPSLSHSIVYKNEYSPAYRVISSKYAGILPLLMAIDTKKPSLVGIDGRCASGKTTTAQLLEEIYDCNIFHTDDFFLPPHMRTEARLNEPGGNMDRERLDRQVIKPVSEKREVVYNKFYCHDFSYSDDITVPYKSLTIVEGSYSLHPQLIDSYGLKVFLDIDKSSQLSRLERREGKVKLETFKNRWIPLEEKYFSTFDIPNKCDLVSTL